MEIRVEKLVNNALGIGHQKNGKVIFLPYVLPDELVKIKIVEEKKDYSLGELEDIIQPSSDRIKPICKFFYKCGGCDLQFVKYNKQLNIKKQILSEFLSSIGYSISIDSIASPSEFYYRNIATFHSDKKKRGFYSKKSHRIIQIDECPLLEKGIIDVLNSTPFIPNSELKIRKDNNGKIVSSVSYEKNNIFTFGLNFKVWIKNFFQINTSIILLWLDKIREYLEPDKNDIILELYSGVGLISLSIANNVKYVYGIEKERSSVKRAISNAESNNILNSYFFSGDVADEIKKIKKCDKIVVDPPRSGINGDTFFNFIQEKKIKKVIYISCNVATFIRDIKKMKNYILKKITLVDMFPQTSHFEIIALLEKSK